MSEERNMIPLILTGIGTIIGTFLDPALIKRVEVVRGPGAMLYGSGALGGVISYETVDAADLLMPGKNTGYRVFGTAGTQDHSLGMGASAYGKTDDLDGIISFSTRDRGNLRMSNGFDSPNDETISNVLTKGTWTIDENQSLSGDLRYYNNAAREPKNPQTEDAGTVADGSPFVGVSAFFPSYAPRAGKEVTLEERLAGTAQE